MPTSVPNIFPQDGYEHKPDKSCPCEPQVKRVQGVGRAMVHNNMQEIIVDSLPVPDEFPEDWVITHRDPGDENDARK